MIDCLTLIYERKLVESKTKNCLKKPRNSRFQGTYGTSVYGIRDKSYDDLGDSFRASVSGYLIHCRNLYRTRKPGMEC